MKEPLRKRLIHYQDPAFAPLLAFMEALFHCVKSAIGAAEEGPLSTVAPDVLPQHRIAAAGCTLLAYDGMIALRAGCPREAVAKSFAAWLGDKAAVNENEIKMPFLLLPSEDAAPEEKPS